MNDVRVEIQTKMLQVLNPLVPVKNILNVLHALRLLAIGPILPLVIGIAVLTGPCPIAFAQQVTQPVDLVDQEEAEETRRFAVELIIFEYNVTTPGDTEVFSPDKLTLDDLTLDDLTLDELTLDEQHPEGPDADAIVDATGIARINQSQDTAGLPEDRLDGEIPIPFDIELEVLDRATFSLTEILEKLEQLDAYSPLFHAGWTQFAEENGERQAIDLRRLGNPPPELDGDLTLYLGRYLHLAAELALADRATATASASKATPFYGDRPMRSGFGDDPYESDVAGPITFRIKEDRIFRNEELRYFDHPKFGMVARVSRVDEIEQPPDQSGL